MATTLRYRVPPIAIVLALAAGPAAGAEKREALTVPLALAAAAYGPSPGLTCPDYGVAGAVIDGVARTAKSRGQTAPTTDGRLCAAATVLLGWPRDEVPLPTCSSSWLAASACSTHRSWSW